MIPSHVSVIPTTALAIHHLLSVSLLDSISWRFIVSRIYGAAIGTPFVTSISTITASSPPPLATTITTMTTARTTTPFLDKLSTYLLGLSDFGLITWKRAFIAGVISCTTVITGGEKSISSMTLGSIPFIGEVHRVEHFACFFADPLNMSKSSGAVPPPGDCPHLTNFMGSTKEPVDVFRLLRRRATCQPPKDKTNGLLGKSVDLSQMRTHGNKLLRTNTNILLWNLCNTFLSKLLQVTLQLHDHHIAHCKHLVQRHLQVCDPSLFILSKAIKFLFNTFNKIDVTQVSE